MKAGLATVTQLLRRRYWIIKRSHQAFGRVRAGWSDFSGQLEKEEGL
jgi:hypothetical protein